MPFVLIISRVKDAKKLRVRRIAIPLQIKTHSFMNFNDKVTMLVF